MARSNGRCKTRGRHGPAGVGEPDVEAVDIGPVRDGGLGDRRDGAEDVLEGDAGRAERVCVPERRDHPLARRDPADGVIMTLPDWITVVCIFIIMLIIAIYD